MTAAAFSSAPSSSSPQPLRVPTGSPPQIFSPFQSQQQQQQLHSAQQPAVMELSAQSGPPSLHQHLDIMGGGSCLTCNKRMEVASFVHGTCMSIRDQGVHFTRFLIGAFLYPRRVTSSDEACECTHCAGPEAPVVNPGPARLVSIGNRLQLDLDPQGHPRHHLHPRCGALCACAPLRALCHGHHEQHGNCFQS